MATAIPRQASAPTSITQAEDPAMFRCIACDAKTAHAQVAVAAEPSDRPFDLAVCDDCGLVQQFPRWSAARIAALYNDDYYVFTEPDESRWARAVQLYLVHMKKLEATAWCSFEERAVKPTTDPASPRLLDVGCALGHFLSLARARGWRVCGLDLSATAVSQAASRFGLEVRGGSLSRHRETLSRFDAVMLADVIEHVADPVRFLEDVHHVLSPDGIVCIDTPNWGSRRRRSEKNKWIGINRFHVNLFDSESLSRLLSAGGFEILSVGSYTNYRYETSDARPEARGWLRWLPKFLAWRIERFLESRRPPTRWSALRENPPADLDAALRQMNELKSSGDDEETATRLASNLEGDNLIVTARRHCVVLR